MIGGLQCLTPYTMSGCQNIVKFRTGAKVIVKDFPSYYHPGFIGYRRESVSSDCLRADVATGGVRVITYIHEAAVYSRQLDRQSNLRSILLNDYVTGENSIAKFEHNLDQNLFVGSTFARDGDVRLSSD